MKMKNCLFCLMLVALVSLSGSWPVWGGTMRASTTDPGTGMTTEWVRDGSGNTTVTRTDADGNTVSQETFPPRNQEPGSMEASSTNPQTGETTAWKRDPQGNTTVTTTNRTGDVTSQTRASEARGARSADRLQRVFGNCFGQRQRG